MDGVTFIEINYDQAWIDSSLLGLAGFSWLYSWGMYLFLIATLGILIWIFFDSITKHKDQQALVPRILAMVGFFLIFPAFIFRFTGNADGIHTLVRLGGEPGTPYYAGPINWNVNWLVKGYGPMIAMVALAGVVVSIVAMVIYASTVQRSKVSIGGVGGTMFGNNLNDRMAALENEVQNVQRAAATPTPIPSAPIPSAPIPSAPAAGMGTRSANGTIIDRKPQAATIIDVPQSGDTLTVQEGNGRGTIYDLPIDDVVVGRDPNSFVVLHDGKVSSKHLKLVYDPSGAWSVLDLGSTNGTYINGQRVSGQAYLNDGDSIKVGDTVLVYRQGH